MSKKWLRVKGAEGGWFPLQHYNDTRLLLLDLQVFPFCLPFPIGLVSSQFFFIALIFLSSPKPIDLGN